MEYTVNEVKADSKGGSYTLSSTKYPSRHAAARSLSKYRKTAIVRDYTNRVYKVNV